MVPKTFSQKHDGDFRRWHGSNVAAADLTRYRPDQDHIFINGIQVYALYFETDDGKGRMWNCKTGWQQKGML